MSKGRRRGWERGERYQTRNYCPGCMEWYPKELARHRKGRSVCHVCGSLLRTVEKPRLR